MNKQVIRENILYKAAQVANLPRIYPLLVSLKSMQEQQIHVCPMAYVATSGLADVDMGLQKAAELPGIHKKIISH